MEFRVDTEMRGIETDRNRVLGIVTDRGRVVGERYLLALGPFAPAFARAAGVHVPIYPVKGYSLTLSIRGWNGAPTVPIVDDGRKLGVVRLGDRLRIAGTAEFAGQDFAGHLRHGLIGNDEIERLGRPPEGI